MVAATVRLVWRFVTGVLEFTGRVIIIALGFVFMVLGILVSATIVGLIIGVPMILMGVLFILRGVF